MWVRMAVLLWVAVGTRAQEDPRALLALVTQRVMDSAGRLPTHVATVTIERKSFEPRVGGQLHSCDDVAAEQKSPHWKVRLATSDTVRVDVASGVPNDLYSWVGEDHYVAGPAGIQLADDQSPGQLVLPGAATTGGLSGLAGVVFSGQDRGLFLYRRPDSARPPSRGIRVYRSAPIQSSSILPPIGTNQHGLRWQISGGAGVGKVGSAGGPHRSVTFTYRHVRGDPIVGVWDGNARPQGWPTAGPGDRPIHKTRWNRTRKSHDVLEFPQGFTSHGGRPASPRECPTEEGAALRSSSGNSIRHGTNSAGRYGYREIW